MNEERIDATDRGILHLLQEDARNTTTTEMGEAVGVSASTVGNRLQRLEEDGIVEGYHPQIDYHDAGFPLRVIFVCTAPIPDRERMARQALEAKGVVNVKEFTVGVENVHVEVVATDRDALTEAARSLDEIGLEVVNEMLVKGEYIQPFDHFGESATEE